MLLSDEVLQYHEFFIENKRKDEFEYPHPRVNAQIHHQSDKYFTPFC